MTDEIVQLKTLQTSLTILQSQLYPRDEVVIFLIFLLLPTPLFFATLLLTVSIKLGTLHFLKCLAWNDALCYQVVSMCDCITFTYMFGLHCNNVSLKFWQDQMAILLGLCLRLLGNNRNSDSVHRYLVHIF